MELPTMGGRKGRIMSDLISREQALHAISIDNLHPGIVSALQSVIEELPSVYAVKHGRWEGYNAEIGWTRSDGSPVFLCCSVCNGTVLNNGSAHWNYCPNCGADMRERKES